MRIISFLDQWMEWITDEKSFAKTNEEKKAVLKLFDRALEDVLCKNIFYIMSIMV